MFPAEAFCNPALAGLLLILNGLRHRRHDFLSGGRNRPVPFCGRTGSEAEVAPTGTLNALDGTISATRSDDVTLYVPTANQTISTAGTTYECLLVPSKVETNKQAVDLTLTIDGEDKTATLSGDNGVIIAKGTKSNITITLSNTGLSVQTVSVEDWNVVEVGEYKVTGTVADDITAGDITSIYTKKHYLCCTTFETVYLTEDCAKMISTNIQADTQSKIKAYRTPEIKILEQKVHSIICTSPSSGNDRLYEQDLGDGGFTQP